MKFSEHSLQVACVAAFRLQWPGKLITMFKNDGFKNPRQGARDKAAGLLAGLPDLAILEPVGAYHGMFVELKVKPNKVKIGSPQDRMIDELRLRGYRVEICYYLEEFMEKMKDYFKN